MSRSRPQTGRPRSRLQIVVATPLSPPAQPQARSRHQNQVATLLTTNLCRDIKFMSRPRSCQQWDFQVVTPKSMSRPPTLSPMSRHQIHVTTPFLLNRTNEVATPNPQCPPATPKSQVTKPETYCNPARSRRHLLVATSRPTIPGRDLITMSRPQEVLPHNDFFFFKIIQ